MSYNITCWKSKKVELVIPVDTLLRCGYSIHVHKAGEETEIRVDHNQGSEMFDMRGSIVGSDLLCVRQIESGGVASGTFHLELKALLAESKGTMEAILVWEGGDYIERLTVVDGVVTEEEVDL